MAVALRSGWIAILIIAEQAGSTTQPGRDERRSASAARQIVELINGGPHAQRCNRQFSKLLDAQGQAIDQVTGQAQAAGDQLVDAIKRQPITAALIIFAAGYLLGKIT